MPSIALRKRIERLEAAARRRSPERPYFDVFPAAMRLWVDLQAVVAGKAEWIQRPAKPLSEEQADALDRAFRDADRVAERFEEARRKTEEARRAAKAERRAERRRQAAAEAVAASQPSTAPDPRQPSKAHPQPP